MIEMVIENICSGVMNYQRIMLLKEKAGLCYLPIWINPAEAEAIAVKMQKDVVPRPLSHDLLYSIIKAMGASIVHVVINDLKDDVYYAMLVLDVDGEPSEFDARPSDAVALAVTAGVPIYAEEVVLEMAGISLDTKVDQPVLRKVKTHKAENKDQKDVGEGPKGVSAFTDFINTLDMDDFGKRKT